MNDLISKAVATLRRSPSSGDAEIHRSLVAEGFEPALAARLVEFLPIAYCRVLFENSGVRFSDSFLRRPAVGESSERLLSSDPVWGEVIAFARDEVERGVSRNDLLAVAGRGAEFDALNQMLNKGSNLRDIILTPMLFTWPEDGPDAEN
jgi:hypothetical protein